MRLYRLFQTASPNHKLFPPHLLCLRSLHLLPRSPHHCKHGLLRVERRYIWIINAKPVSLRIVCFEGCLFWSLNLLSHIVAEWAACMLAVTRCQSVSVNSADFVLLASIRTSRGARRWRPQNFAQAASHTKWGKQSAGPWGKALIRIVSYHKPHNWIIHVLQLYSISYLICRRMWAWKHFFEVWKCWPLAWETS